MLAAARRFPFAKVSGGTGEVCGLGREIRCAGGILSGAHRFARAGMGDIMSLIERAEQAVDKKGRDGTRTEAAQE